MLSEIFSAVFDGNVFIFSLNSCFLFHKTISDQSRDDGGDDLCEGGKDE